MRVGWVRALSVERRALCLVHSAWVVAVDREPGALATAGQRTPQGALGPGPGVPVRVPWRGRPGEGPPWA